MKLMDLKDLAQEISLSVYTLRKFAREGMPHYRVGKKILINQNEFESWFAAHFRGDADTNDDDLANIIDEAVAAVIK
jgi:hypothetical protein